MVVAKKIDFFSRKRSFFSKRNRFFAEKPVWKTEADTGFKTQARKNSISQESEAPRIGSQNIWEPYSGSLISKPHSGSLS